MKYRGVEIRMDGGRYIAYKPDGVRLEGEALSTRQKPPSAGDEPA